MYCKAIGGIMDIKECNRYLESIDSKVCKIRDMANFIGILCNAEFIDATSSYMYLLVDSLKNECAQLEIKRMQMQAEFLE